MSWASVCAFGHVTIGALYDGERSVFLTLEGRCSDVGFAVRAPSGRHWMLDPKVGGEWSGVVQGIAPAKTLSELGKAVAERIRGSRAVVELLDRSRRNAVERDEKAAIIERALRQLGESGPVSRVSLSSMEAQYTRDALLSLLAETRHSADTWRRRAS